MLKKARIALIDDHDPSREALERLLRAASVRVVSFRSPCEFLASADLESANCVIADAHLPGMDCPELCAHLAARKPGLPIIALTSQPRPTQLEKLHQAGVVAYLAKPVEWETLSQAISAALRQAGN